MACNQADIRAWLNFQISSGCQPPAAHEARRKAAITFVRSTGYVVIELKTGKFQPEYAGKLNFYVALVDDVLRCDHHNETIGILICGTKNDRSVRYSLGRSTSPVAVAAYTYDKLPRPNSGPFPTKDTLSQFWHGPNPLPTPARPTPEPHPRSERRVSGPSENQ